MNVETGQIYRGEEEIRKARERGEPIRELSPEEVERIQRERQEAKSRERDRVLASYAKPLPRGYKDRSGSKPVFRRDKVRAKNKAARKARKKSAKGSR